MPPKSPLTPPSLLPFWIQHPKLGVLHLHAQRKLGVPPLACWFSDLDCCIIKERRTREEKDQGTDQRVDHDPDFILICRMIVLREERSTPKRTVPDWSWVDTHRGWRLAWLRENLLSFRSRFKERNYETGMWFDHIFNFSMHSISAYELWKNNTLQANHIWDAIGYFYNLSSKLM